MNFTCIPDYSDVLHPGVPVDVAANIAPLVRGTADPTAATVNGVSWFSFQPSTTGPVTVAIQHPISTVEPAEIRYHVWARGDDAAIDYVVQRMPVFLGVDEQALAGWAEFDELLARTAHLLPERVVAARRKNPGMRFMATGQLVDELLTVVLEQKVTQRQARATWGWLAKTYGEASPAGEPASKLAPKPQRVLDIPSWEWHAGWVQPFMVRTLKTVASRASALHRLAHQPLERISAGLTSLPGIGPWTVAETLQRTHGAADYVAVGDYHIAHHVGEALTGRRTDDEEMLELLEPWVGHRQRIVRLIYASGIRFSRFGPRMAATDFRDR
ncbi:MAG TPA: 3-methyladenine DNA glycosylase [Enteractinococcus sp.]